MKLAEELNFVVEQFKKIPDLEGYAAWLKENGEYKNFETRLAWDCMHVAVGTKTMCGWYDKYGCTDVHIDTLAKKALSIVRGRNVKCTGNTKIHTSSKSNSLTPGSN